MAKRHEPAPAGSPEMHVKHMGGRRGPVSTLPKPWPAHRPASVLGEADLDRIAAMLKALDPKTEAVQELVTRIAKMLGISSQKAEAAHEQVLARIAEGEQVLARIAEGVEAELEAPEPETRKRKRLGKKQVSAADIVREIEALVATGLSRGKARSQVAKKLGKPPGTVERMHQRVMKQTRG